MYGIGKRVAVVEKRATTIEGEDSMIRSICMIR